MLWGCESERKREGKHYVFGMYLYTLREENKSFAFVLAIAAALIMIYQMLDVEKYHAFLSEHCSE